MAAACRCRCRYRAQQTNCSLRNSTGPFQVEFRRSFICSSSEPSLRGFCKGQRRSALLQVILPNPHQVLWSVERTPIYCGWGLQATRPRSGVFLVSCVARGAVFASPEPGAAGKPEVGSRPRGADGASATALQPPPHLLTTLPATAGGGRCGCHGTPATAAGADGAERARLERAGWSDVVNLAARQGSLTTQAVRSRGRCPARALRERSGTDDRRSSWRRCRPPTPR